MCHLDQIYTELHENWKTAREVASESSTLMEKVENTYHIHGIDRLGRGWSSNNEHASIGVYDATREAAEKKAIGDMLKKRTRAVKLYRERLYNRLKQMRREMRKEWKCHFPYELREREAREAEAGS